ncbi:MAG TPA: flavin reductase family protein [Herbaspirillum sp.]|jgi:flavin reductase (DIM6/NTAB) family NADH-FMN oxidoreductase RutF|nr:flavin reductase family protein [Herbaspirillum sp.]
MFLDFSTLESREAYRWMASAIAPRPIAWVSSLSGEGVANLAPFSFFQMITAKPPTLMISPLVQTDGSKKDTVRNIRQTGEFVVNLVPHALRDMMNQTSFGYDGDTSEFEACGVPSLPSQRVKPPRVSGVPVSFECRLVSCTPYPADQPSCYVIFGEVVAAHIDETILAEDGQIDPVRLDLLSRMGGKWYGRTAGSGNFELERPEGWRR